MNKQTVRTVQTCIILAVAFYATVVCLGNLLDYNSNWQFVKHVLSMDTTFKGNALMWRAITNESLQTIAYWGIILSEAVIAVLGWVAGIKMLMKRNRSSDAFASAKTFGYYAFLLGFLVWFVGFICIGSEWFAMWQSSVWNGKQTAMDIVEVLGVFLVIYMMPEEGRGLLKK